MIINKNNKMLRSGSICVSLLYKYLTSENEYKEDEDSGKVLIKKATNLKILSETFQNYGGVLAKLSQIICSEEKDSQVFSDCKPFSQGKTIEYIKDLYETDKNFFKKIDHIDFTVFKSGSVGQVHKAIYNDKENLQEIVIKVQYVGLSEQVKTDLFILDKLTAYLYGPVNLKNAMADIKTKLNEELDYTQELLNQQLLYNIWKNNKNIKIPKAIPELSTDKILAMEFINAQSLNDFIENSNQDEKNIIGKYIIEFIFTNIYDKHIFYSDIHYGNFLVKDYKKLYVMDFGCVSIMDHILINNLKKIHKSILSDDINLFYSTLEDMTIINLETISEESKKYILEYFKLQYTPWTCDGEFEFNQEWLEKSVYKNMDLMKEWNLPSNIVYLNKIPYGLYHILTKLKLKGNFSFVNKLL